MIPEMDNKPKIKAQDPDRVLTERLRTSRKLLDFARSGSNETSNPPAPSAAKDNHSPHLFSGEKLLTQKNPEVNEDLEMFKMLGLKPRKAFKDFKQKLEVKVE